MITIPDLLISHLKAAKKIVFFTGAGISAESGIPTFRGQGGIWNKLSPNELANFSAFLRNPALVWEWYSYRRSIVNESQPNPGHLAIADFQNYYDVSVVTQNVDNLHRRAGSKIIYELHGNIERNYCIRCKKDYEVEAEVKKGDSPKCSCGGLVRPDVVWFGENLPEDKFLSSELAAVECDIFFSVGTSANVYPAANIPILAKRNGAFLVEINTEKTEASYIMNMIFQGKSGEIIPEIIKEVRSFLEKK